MTLAAPWRSALYFLPALVFAVVAGYFLWGLTPTRDPSHVPSNVIDKPAPEFELPPVQGLDEPGFASGDLAGSSPKLVNFFASWCVPCRAEHPHLMALADRLPVYGINYKDKPKDAVNWLGDHGNPYARVGADAGRSAISWGVYGVPETFLVHDGRIRFHHRGPLTETIVKEELLPLVEAFDE